MSAENFQACLAFVLKYEGGKSNDPHDPGGRTNQGITQATYDAYRPEKRDVFLMTAAERDEIYLTQYWDRIHADRMMPGEDLATFDLAVNSGPARALAIRSGVLQTNGISTASVRISGICAKRLSFLHALGTWSYFGSGWGKRVAACEVTGLKMAGADLGQVADDARASKAAHKRLGTGAVAGGAASAAWLHTVLAHGLWAVLAVVVLVAGIVVISAFSAWRHGQRVDALTQAIKDMRAAETAAALAKTIALAKSISAEKEIATKQAALDAARKAIGTK